MKSVFTISLQGQESSLLDYSLMIAFWYYQRELGNGLAEAARNAGVLEGDQAIDDRPTDLHHIQKGFPRFLMAMRAWKRLTPFSSKTLQPARLSETF